MGKYEKIGVYVYIKDENGVELSEDDWDINYDGDIEITIKRRQINVISQQGFFDAVSDLARDKCPQFLPFLEGFQRALTLEELRPR